MAHVNVGLFSQPVAVLLLQDPHVLTTINAVYALVKAVDLALIDRCGDSYSSVCKEFMSAPDAMQLIISKLDEVSTQLPEAAGIKAACGEPNW